jgi:para-nitrobenzyl esterase
MVYVHGGSFDLGCSAGFQGGGGLAVGNLAAEQGVVVMTMDYRLGPLGFLSLPELRAEDPAHPSAGNYGIEDQIAALQWVKQNAAAFGGDPTNVTIFGESAGGISMYVHLASPKSAGLFQRVIVSDGYSAYNDLFALNQATADQAGAAFVSPFDCNPGELLSCLRGTSVADLIASEGSYSIAPYGYSWLPVVDGFVLPADPAVLLGAGTFNKVPTLFQVATNQPNNSDNLSCPTLHSARACASAGVPTFLTNLTYAFNDPPDLPTVPYDGEQTLFVFDNAANTGISFTPQEQLLGQQIRAYWASMAATGNPNGGGRFPWPAFDLSTEQNLVLDTTLTTQTALRVGAICGLPAQDGGTSDAASE